MHEDLDLLIRHLFNLVVYHLLLSFHSFRLEFSEFYWQINGFAAGLNFKPIEKNESQIHMSKRLCLTAPFFCLHFTVKKIYRFKITLKLHKIKRKKTLNEKCNREAIQKKNVLFLLRLVIWKFFCVYSTWTFFCIVDHFFMAKNITLNIRYRQKFTFIDSNFCRFNS